MEPALNTKVFTSSILTLKPLLHKKCNVAGRVGRENVNDTLKVVAGVRAIFGRPAKPPWCAHSSQALYLAKSAKRSICGARHCKGWAPQADLATEHYKNTLGLGTAGIRCHGHCRNTAGYGRVGHCRDPLRPAAVGHCKNVLRQGTAGILGGWTLQGYSACSEFFLAGRCKDTLRLGTAGTLGGWALQGYALWLGTAGSLGGRALQGCLVVAHGGDALRLGPAVRLRAEGEDNMDFKI